MSLQEDYIPKYSFWNTGPGRKVSVPIRFVEAVCYIIPIKKHIGIAI